MQTSNRPGGVVVVGSISADLTAFGRRLPRPGETVLGDEFTLVLGGKGANQAVAAVRAGAPTFVIGAVGNDLFQEVTLGALRGEGVNVDAVAVLPGHTGVAHIRVDRDSGQNDIMIIPHANGEVTGSLVEDRLRGLAGWISVLLLQLEIPMASVLTAARVGRDLGCQVVLDPAPAQPLPEQIWPLVDVVTPNELEAEVLTGISPTDEASAEAAGRWFCDRGVGTAVVTLAERGAVVVSRDGVRHLPAYPVRAVDTTAAGDGFTGSVGAGLAAGLGWDELVRRALATGALTVTRTGASPSIPTAAQVDDFLASLPC